MDYGRRRQLEAERREATARHLAAPVRIVEVPVACRCDFLPYQHVLEQGSYLKQVHDGPRDVRYDRTREMLWKAAGKAA